VAEGSEAYPEGCRRVEGGDREISVLESSVVPRHNGGIRRTGHASQRTGSADGTTS